jgi:hypothetical protein
VASSAALQLLASLTRLTWLDLGRTGVSAGLGQLASLKGLGSLSLNGCAHITDEHLQPLSALTGLTRLDANSTGVQGSGLAALGSLRHLSLHGCSNLGAAALSQVAQLTRLTYLRISDSATEAGPAQLAQLAQLTNVQELRTGGHIISQQVAVLLELPSLGVLGADSIAVQQGHAVSGSAITRLVLSEPAAADLQTLPQLPALQSLVIGAADTGTMSSISAQQQLAELVVGEFVGVQAGELATALQGLSRAEAHTSNAAAWSRPPPTWPPPAPSWRALPAPPAPAVLLLPLPLVLLLPSTSTPSLAAVPPLQKLLPEVARATSTALPCPWPAGGGGRLSSSRLNLIRL